MYFHFHYSPKDIPKSTFLLNFILYQKVQKFENFIKKVIKNEMSKFNVARVALADIYFLFYMFHLKLVDRWDN